MSLKRLTTCTGLHIKFRMLELKIKFNCKSKVPNSCSDCAKNLYTNLRRRWAGRRRGALVGQAVLIHDPVRPRAGPALGSTPASSSAQSAFSGRLRSGWAGRTRSPSRTPARSSGWAAHRWPASGPSARKSTTPSRQSLLALPQQAKQKLRLIIRSKLISTDKLRLN